MREGWTYKKLGEICEIERGGSPRPIQQYITDDEDGLNWIKIGDAVEGSKFINSTKEKIIKEGLKKTRFVHKGDFILSNSMSFGKPYILGIDGCIHDGWLVIRDTHDIFDKSFLYYLLGSPNMYNEFKRMAVGGVVNNLNSQMVRSVSVPVPPLSEQERIVSELDLLSSIIEKKKAQLKEYDKLAQSIFYDMFGDPVTNEKGWEVTKLNSIYKVTSSKRILQEEWKKEGVPFYKVADIVSLIHSEKVIPSAFISDSTYDNLLQHGQVPSVGDILVTSRGTLGQCYIVKAEDKFYFQDGMITWLSQKEKCILPIYLKMLFSSDSFLNSIEQMANSSTIAYISINQLSKKIIPLPPLPLQQFFASKIEAIERQKALVQQSIVETQTMFDYKMDKYFG